MTELLAAILGALAAYVFDIRRRAAESEQKEQGAARDLRRRRESTATALLQDLRNSKTTLRQLFHRERPALWIGQQPSLYFDALKGDVRLFTPDAVPMIDEFYRRLENLFGTLAAASPAQRGDPKFNHFIRVTAGFVLQAMPEAKQALLAEGAKMPTPRVVEVVQPPNLPTVPKPCFPDVPAPGNELPPELQ